MKFTPLGDRVMVKRIDNETKTPGGVWIPDTAQEKPSKGVVVACGTGGFDNNGNAIIMNVTDGDTVMFGKWSGVELKIDSDTYVVMNQSDIIGVFKE
jgi:chaperonin GroES